MHRSASVHLTRVIFIIKILEKVAKNIKNKWSQDKGVWFIFFPGLFLMDCRFFFVWWKSSCLIKVCSSFFMRCLSSFLVHDSYLLVDWCSLYTQTLVSDIQLYTHNLQTKLFENCMIKSMAVLTYMILDVYYKIVE